MQDKIIAKAIPERDRKSQGSKPVQCVRCSADIPPYAGVRVSRYADRFIHQPGRCATAEAELKRLRAEVNGQASFAWSCTIATPRADMPLICREQGTSREAFAAHMKQHGATELHAQRPVRLRKRPRPRSFPKSPVASVFKTVRWRDGSGAWHRGQFWSDSDQPHCVWVIDYDTRRAVRVYILPEGSGTTDWYELRRVRRDWNRSERQAKSQAA
jgi:hypothetical protein